MTHHNSDVIYLDHSATTPLDPRVLAAMLPYFTEDYGNSMALHRLGRSAERAIDTARDSIARELNCEPHNIVFTSGGSESDNLALRGPAQFARTHDRPFTLITSTLEHHAISATARQLGNTLGAALRILSADRYGRVDPDDLRATLHNLPENGIALVTLIHTHNEIGTRNPIADYAAIAHEYGALFHSDTVQSPAYDKLDVQALGVDMLSLSSHKFYGPKGSGALYIADRVPYMSAQTGAKHEDYRRAGTHNTPGIVGTAKALELVAETRSEIGPRLTILREKLVAAVLDRVPDAALTGDPVDRLPGHVSFVFRDVNSSTLLMHLDQHGIAASSGSACKVGNEQPSAILAALGYGPEWTRGGLRLTMGQHTTAAQIDRVIDVLPDAVATVRRLRTLSF
ncbi:MAG: cysteine desulfurase [Anaerolineae bacterium]|nr:cysteine desulfurase [Anaerolineae bacterium]